MGNNRWIDFSAKRYTDLHSHWYGFFLFSKWKLRTTAADYVSWGLLYLAKSMILFLPEIFSLSSILSKILSLAYCEPLTERHANYTNSWFTKHRFPSATRPMCYIYMSQVSNLAAAGSSQTNGSFLWLYIWISNNLICVL